MFKFQKQAQNYDKHLGSRVMKFKNSFISIDEHLYCHTTAMASNHPCTSTHTYTLQPVLQCLCHHTHNPFKTTTTTQSLTPPPTTSAPYHYYHPTLRHYCHCPSPSPFLLQPPPPTYTITTTLFHLRFQHHCYYHYPTIIFATSTQHKYNLDVTIMSTIVRITTSPLIA